MRNHSFADSHGALREAARLLVKAANWVEKQDRFFWHKVRMARFGPDIHFPVNREIEEPFRVARCVALHLEPFRPGIVFGWYARPTIDPEDDNAVAEHFRRAVTVRKPTEKELEAFDDEARHGPGTHKPPRLRTGATSGVAVREGGPEQGVEAPGAAGAGQ